MSEKEGKSEDSSGGVRVDATVRPRNFEQYLILESYNFGRSVARARIKRELEALIEWWGRQKQGHPSGLPKYKIEKLMRCVDAA